MSKTLRVLFLLLGPIAIPIVSVLIISTSFELVRSLYPSFYNSYSPGDYDKAFWDVLIFKRLINVFHGAF
jgi:hypothetical protein